MGSLAGAYVEVGNVDAPNKVKSGLFDSAGMRYFDTAIANAAKVRAGLIEKLSTDGYSPIDAIEWLGGVDVALWKAFYAQNLQDAITTQNAKGIAHDQILKNLTTYFERELDVWAPNQSTSLYMRASKEAKFAALKWVLEYLPLLAP